MPRSSASRSPRAAAWWPRSNWPRRASPDQPAVRRAARETTAAPANNALDELFRSLDTWHSSAIGPDHDGQCPRSPGVSSETGSQATNSRKRFSLVPASAHTESRLPAKGAVSAPAHGDQVGALLSSPGAIGSAQRASNGAARPASSVRTGVGVHPAVSAQRAPRRRHRARALHPGGTGPQQRLRRCHDERAPRRFRGVHGAATADGLLRAGAARDGWAAAAPLLLPLRPTALVAEEVAWLQARHRGRVGLGVAAGALPLDFDVAGVDQAESVARFKSELPRLVAMLRGEDLGQLEGDPALRACRANPVPVLSAAVSVAAAVRAARCGAGILMEGMSAPSRLARLTDAFGEAGGTGSVVLIRRVWLGSPRSGLVARQRAVYESYAERAGSFGEDQTIASRSRPSWRSGSWRASGRSEPTRSTSGSSSRAWCPRRSATRSPTSGQPSSTA